MGRHKITIVGAGNVGATAAHWAVVRELGDVVLVDVVEGIPQGKALDLLEATPVAGASVNVTGANKYDATRGSDVVIITAGVPRKPGMSREDLLQTNAKIMREVTEQVVRYSPDAFINVVSNPVDTMTWLCQRVSELPVHQVMGMAGVLDTTRYRTFIAQALGVSVRDVTALVLGGHGDDMVPLVRLTTVGGVPVTELLGADKLAAIVERTRKGGGEIVNLLKAGSAYYAPGAACIEMAEAILRDQKRLLPVIAHLSGEYGERNLYLGVPAILGAGGVERVIELQLTAAERAALGTSIDSVKANTAALGPPWTWRNR